MQGWLEVDVQAAEPHEPRRGVARRHGFSLHWTATWTGTEWTVSVPSGQSREIAETFSIVTADDWPRFQATIIQHIVRAG